MKLSSSWKSTFLLLIISLITLAIGLEVAIRTYDAGRGIGFFSEHRNLVARGISNVLPFRMFGLKQLYKNQDGARYINSRHGELYPLKKPNNTFRIVVFGGSTSENSYSYNAAGIHYPLLLQSELRKALNRPNIEVINVAHSAYSTVHALILFELDVLSWEPDLIIVSFNINDLLVSYWPDFAFDYSNTYSYKAFLPDNENIYTVSNIMLQHSELYWFVKSRIERLLDRGSTGLQRKAYGNKPPSLSVEVFERNLRSIISIAKSNGIKVLLGNQPLQPSKEYFVKHMRAKSFNSIVSYPIHNEFVEHHRVFNNTIQKVAEDTRVLFINNHFKLNGIRDYFIDFVHYTPEGVKRLVKNYTDFLLKENIVIEPGKK